MKSANICIIPDCHKPQKYGNGMCGMHWVRGYRAGLSQNTRTRTKNCYVVVEDAGRRLGEHVLMAERAVGSSLPKGAHVHHVNGLRADNRPENLVICPSTAYHKLLHTRADALAACGHAGWVKCWICKQYDDPKDLYTNGYNAHIQCRKRHSAEYYKKMAGHNGAV